MSNQGGLKHAATEPTRLDSKRERRRGAAGRASVLRRAPSDSDCSGETASLSADSGDRAPRPLPSHTSGKSRSRRRGSEWEVLEGLKDGQRFDRKPEVFNGYLHKKRKWPLKGWHKRFFVVDAGILVYARSPTDVARGRLHGSVDVGLSVISAKTRRRRIDIDADEFIYHLRAKTAEVFRTWLNVLKAHRLYRQHLLTFGTRESAPKTALDDLPATDGSTRTMDTGKILSPIPKEFHIGDYSNQESIISGQIACQVEPSVYQNKIQNPINLWCFESSNFCEEATDIELRNLQNPHSLCSMHCLTRRNVDLMSFEIKCQAEQQIHSLDLESPNESLKESLLNNISLNSPNTNNSLKSSMFNYTKSADKETLPCYFFTRKKSKAEIRKSNKSTNLFKYRNSKQEPRLKQPLKKCTLLGDIHTACNDEMTSKDDEVQVKVEHENKMIQDSITLSEHDKIIEHLVLSFANNIDNTNVLSINEIVKEIYEKSENIAYPVKKLFKCLLEYWIKNTATDKFKCMVQAKSVNKPSNNHFTKDAQLSSKIIYSDTKETQYRGVPWNIMSKHHNIENRHRDQKNPHLPHRRDNRLDERDSRTEKLESVLKNTVYICDTTHDRRKQDIMITKTLMNNIGCNNNSIAKDNVDEYDKSTLELIKLQDTIKNLISDTSLPSSVAKEFFNAYLSILLSDNSRSTAFTSSESSFSKETSTKSPQCDVHAEPVQKLVSKSVVTDNTIDEPKDSYFKEMIGKISSVFTKHVNVKRQNPCNNFECFKITLKNKEPLNDRYNNNNLEDKHLKSNAKENSSQLSKTHNLNMDISQAESEVGNINYWLPKLSEPDSLSGVFGCTNKHSQNIPVQDHKKCSENKNLSRNIVSNRRRLSYSGSLSFKSSTSYNPSESYSCNILGNGKRKTKPKRRMRLLKTILTRAKPCHPSCPLVTKETTSKVIDERFILVLLENLVLLSRNMPLFHADIYNMYLKLRKKYEDTCVLKNSEISKSFNDKNEVETSNSLNAVKSKRKNISDIKYLDQHLCKISCIKPSKTDAGFVKFIDTQNWSLQDSKLTNSNNYLVDSLNFTKANPGVQISECTKKSIQEKLLTELATLSPLYRVATQSQTERLLRVFKDRNDTNFGIYRVVVKKQRKSSSLNISTGSFVGKYMSDDLKTIYRCSSEPSYCSGLISPTVPPLRGPQAGFVSGTPGGRLAGWIIESGGPLETASRELGQAQLSVQQLQRLLDALELQQQAHHDTDVSLEGASPNVKKDRRKFGLRKKKSSTKCSSVELSSLTIDSSNSHMALSALTAPPSPGGCASSVPNSAASLPIACAAARPQSLPGAEALGATGPASLTSLTPDHQLREDFTILAKDLVASLKGIVATMERERGRLRAAVEASEATSSPGGAVVTALRTNLSSALQQNSELRTRLSRIHDASDLAEVSSMGTNDPTTVRHFQQSLSYSSSCVSASEFFDAEEHDEDKEIIDADEAGVIELDGDSTSEAGSLSSEEGSASSDNSEVLSAEQVTLRVSTAPPSLRRARLPAPRPTPGGPSLWNLLYKNIGKDLSQISMPVTINEPLNMLQRLCEELEYSELLDGAAATADPLERLCCVAAFAVSAYAASGHRAASKPFNPLLGETYECIREDRQFRFLAEQVSHHPPISACHAESPRWVFWQEARIKTKFWGKSMEFQPTGRVHVKLLPTGDHYSWNKVTTCVHNLFGGQRWVDQYGDMHIICHGTDITCKLNFIKASPWSGGRHEVRGAACGAARRVRLAGRWSEALLCGEPPAARALWRPGAMPPDHELYYGFTRFAMELNELEPGMKEVLPHTDTRLRPDQRALEEGDVEAAEQYKLQLEQAQRERRRTDPEHTPAWFRKSFENGEETWVFTGEYWSARDAGFKQTLPSLW